MFQRLDYKNEAGGDPPDKPANAPDVDADDTATKTAYSIPVYSTHQLTVNNVSFYMEEFRIANVQRPDHSNKCSENITSIASEQFYSTMSELPESAQPKQTSTADEVSSCSEDDNENDSSEMNRTDALQIAQLHGAIDIKITTKV